MLAGRLLGLVVAVSLGSAGLVMLAQARSMLRLLLGLEMLASSALSALVLLGGAARSYMAAAAAEGAVLGVAAALVLVASVAGNRG